MLFQRILQNTIHDHFRRQKVRSTWTTLLSALGKGDEKDEDFDPLETLEAKSDSNATVEPAKQLEQKEIMALIEQALAKLPARQREAFLLRYWEEFDVAETAAAMEKKTSGTTAVKSRLRKTSPNGLAYRASSPRARPRPAPAATASSSNAVKP